MVLPNKNQGLPHERQALDISPTLTPEILSKTAENMNIMDDEMDKILYFLELVVS
jgi:hypothetical protein